MIEIEIPKDIRRYESKLVGPFTTRQTICAAIVCLVSVATFSTLKSIPTDFRLFIITIFDLPFLLLGWVKPYGMKFEQFMSTALISTFVAPKYRKYKSKNAFAEHIQSNMIKKKKKKKPNKEFKAYK